MSGCRAPDLETLRKECGRYVIWMLPAIYKLYRVWLERYIFYRDYGDMLYVPNMKQLFLICEILLTVRENLLVPENVSSAIVKYTKSCLHGAYARQSTREIKGSYIEFKGGWFHLRQCIQITRDLLCKGNPYLLDLVDNFTKFVIAKPIQILGARVTVANLKEILGEQGFPGSIISDRGLAFTR